MIKPNAGVGSNFKASLTAAFAAGEMGQEEGEMLSEEELERLRREREAAMLAECANMMSRQLQKQQEERAASRGSGLRSVLANRMGQATALSTE